MKYFVICITRLLLLFVLYPIGSFAQIVPQVVPVVEPPKALAKSFYSQKTTYDSLFFSQSYLVSYIQREVKHFSFHTASFANPKGSSVMPHTFDLLYRKRSYKQIKYVPANIPLDRLTRYQTLMGGTSHSQLFKSQLPTRRPIYTTMRQVVFMHPEHVVQKWSDVPDVSNIGKNYITRKSANKVIQQLNRDSLNTRPSLERIVVTKKPWVFVGTENIQLAQGYLDNWVKGGESSINLSSDLRLKATYEKDKSRWESNVIHKVGILATENETSRMTDDMIQLNTKYGWAFSKKWYYSFLTDFKTQFFYGYDKSDELKENPISGFMSPGYMSFALGVDFKPNKDFTLLISPLTSRLTIVADTVKIDPGRYKIPEGKKVDVLNGISVVNNFKYKIVDEITIASSFDLFYQFLSDRNNKQVQLDWEAILDMRINRFLSTRLIGHLRYFTNESDKVQIRETFNIAFKYNF